MLEKYKARKLKKDLKLIDVYAIATGTTLSAGFFLLPGLAAISAGPALVLAYILAAVPLIPAMFSIIELATAMPKAGGVYYFLDRTLGPLMGTIGGIGTWLALILKVAFALIGMGAYLSLFISGISIVPLAISIALIIGLLNLFSVKGSGKFQVFLVISLLIILMGFLWDGLPRINISNFQGLFNPGFSAIFSTTGLVYISYVGVTKVASLAEEVKDPEKNLPLGLFLSLGTAFIIYLLGTVVMVGIVPMDQLKGDLTPVASAAKNLLGNYGVVLITIAALLSFISVANAGTMSASRYPFAMSRDYIMPRYLQKLNKKGIPFISVIITVILIILILLFLDPMKIAKLASVFQLLMFAFINLAVIVMRESHIVSYDPGYRSPFYPWMQIIGILSGFFLIFEMGWVSISFSGGLIIISIIWYLYFAKNKIERTGAIYHVFERLGQFRYHALDSELRGILKEKGLRKEDPFDEIVARSFVIVLKEKTEFEVVADLASQWLTKLTPFAAEEIKKQFMDGTKIGMTPVTHDIALPHLKIAGLKQPEMVLVKSDAGVHIMVNGPLTNHLDEEFIVHAVFFLISPEESSTQHLRILAQIAERVDEEEFTGDWKKAKDEQEIKETLLHNEQFLSLIIKDGNSTSNLIGVALKDFKLPGGCLIAILRRGDKVIVPNGSTILRANDRLTIIGEPKGLSAIRKRYFT